MCSFLFLLFLLFTTFHDALCDTLHMAKGLYRAIYSDLGVILDSQGVFSLLICVGWSFILFRQMSFYWQFIGCTSAKNCGEWNVMLEKVWVLHLPTSPKAAMPLHFIYMCKYYTSVTFILINLSIGPILNMVLYII